MTCTRRVAGLTMAVLSVVAANACHKAPPPQPPAPVQASVPGPNADSIRAPPTSYASSPSVKRLRTW
jgi:hypothetical protein